MALPCKPMKTDPYLLALLEATKHLPPMTPAQMREQRISWAYGNCALDNPRITRKMVEDAHDKMYGKPEQ